LIKPASFLTPPAAAMISSTVISPHRLEYPTFPVKRFVGSSNSLMRGAGHAPQMAMQTLADRLRELRAEVGRSQTVVAAEVGIERSTLAVFERGHDKPGRDTLIALANYYVVSIEWLVSGEGEKRPPRALSINEERLLSGYRTLPPDEADAILRLVTARGGGAPLIELPPRPRRAAKRGRG
jgi:transcriptional regulator with XRE-family HTH domain